MSLKAIVTKQYIDKMNRTVELGRYKTLPPEGWLRTARKAIGLSAAQLARRLGVTRALVSRTEKAELSGSVTIKTLQTMAESMGYHLVYALVPKQKVEKMLAARAEEKARHIVDEAHGHMALEEQALSDKQRVFETKRVKEDLLRNPPADFWDDKR